MRASASFAVVAALASPGHAQEASGGLQEIVVTARRREQNLQTTPVSVTAFGTEQLDKLPVTRIEDMQSYVPNFYMSRGTSNPSTLNVTPRGTGEGGAGFATSEPPVAFYLDDVYQARLAATHMEFADIERIEVLRGPQGTLFGRNSMSGAVNVITRAPGNGSYDEYKLKGVISGPVIADRLAASLSVAKTDQGQDKLGFEGARVNLRWLGSDKLDARLIAYYSDAENDGFVPTAISPTTLQPLTGDYFKVQLASPSRGDTETWGVNGRVSYDFGGVTFKALSAYAEIDDLFRFDLSGGIRRPNGSYVAGFDRTSTYQQHQFSQELQLQSNDEPGSAFSWIGGLYYFSEGVAQQLADLAFISAFGIVVPLPVTTYAATTESYAAFGQGTWKPGDRLGLTLGMRYTRED